MAIPHLLDTNTLLRLAKLDDPEHNLVRTAMERLIDQGSDLCYTPQNVVGFWNVFTRPKDKNGFGLTVAEANRETGLLEREFTLLPDNNRIHIEWRQLVVALSVHGVQVHDARLVAAMRVHGVTHLLTLNTGDFARYPGITVRHPQEVTAQQRS